MWVRGSTPHPRSLQAGWAATVLTIAGDGADGVRDGDAARAPISNPFGVAVAADGTIYIADAGAARRIRRPWPDGTISSLAGDRAGFQDGVARGASTHHQASQSTAAARCTVADTGNNAIRRIAPDGAL